MDLPQTRNARLMELIEGLRDDVLAREAEFREEIQSLSIISGVAARVS